MRVEERSHRNSTWSSFLRSKSVYLFCLEQPLLDLVRDNLNQSRFFSFFIRTRGRFHCWVMFHWWWDCSTSILPFSSSDSLLTLPALYNLWPCNGTGPHPPSIEQCQVGRRYCRDLYDPVTVFIRWFMRNGRWKSSRGVLNWDGSGDISGGISEILQRNRRNGTVIDREDGMDDMDYTEKEYV